MKTILALFVMLQLAAQAQVGTYVYHPPSQTAYQGDWTGAGFVPHRNGLPAKDPLRRIGNRVWTVPGQDFTNGWVAFNGTVLQVLPDGILIRGNVGDHPETDNDVVFFVAHFPYSIARDEEISFAQTNTALYCAKLDGTYTYKTVAGDTRTIRKLDYGEIYVPPPPVPLTPEEIAARTAAEQKRKKDVEAKTIKWLQEQADAGDAFSQLRMGERYLNGDGVETNATKARKLLQKSAAQGNTDAADLLQKIAQR